MSVTLDDIAAKLGVSKTTVSLTLRNHPNAGRFTSQTRRRIQVAAQKLGYQPNFFAAQLAKSRSTLLMACVNHLISPWAMAVFSGLEKQAAERKHRLLITSLQGQEEPLAFHRDILGSKGVGAMAVVGCHTRGQLSDSAIRGLADSGIKIVLVERELDHPGVGQVVCGNYEGARAAAEHLYERGLDDLWILSVQSDISDWARHRLRGYLDVARERGAAMPPVLPMNSFPVNEDAYVTKGYEAVKNRLRGHKPPRAILSNSDSAAVGAERALMEAGLSVGGDVAVVGFDGGIFSQTAWPPLSTVAQPTEAMGRAAADMLINMLEDPDRPAEKVVLPTELIVRESSGGVKVDRGNSLGVSTNTGGL
jgi:DNA-binding LacI/PurR family transcriptional regulator